MFFMFGLIIPQIFIYLISPNRNYLTIRALQMHLGCKVDRKIAELCFNPFMPGDLWTSVVWTRHTFENNFGTKYKFAKYLKGSSKSCSDEQFSFKYFLYIA